MDERGIQINVALCNVWLVVVELPDWRHWRPNQTSCFQSSANAGAVDPPYLYLADDTTAHGIPISAPLRDL